MRRASRLMLANVVSSILAVAGAHAAAPGVAQRSVTPSAPVFPGIRSFPIPSWPKEPEAPAGAPNVLIIMTDDVGFAASSTFGGVIPTDAFTALAKDGLKYTDFNTTSICSPTRASLLTGRDPHAIQFGSATASNPNAYDGYTSVLPRSAAMIAEILKQHGYSTAAFGKWHMTPEWEQSPQVGPFNHWPTEMGFQHFYGFINADTDQFAPTLVEDLTPIQPPTHDPAYILDRDLAAHAIAWIRQQHAVAPNKPFFLYYAPGSTHAPQQAPKAWIEKFKGKFNMGWDRLREQIFARQKAMGIVPPDAKLTPRPPELLAWNSLSPDQKRIAERFMEVYAAQLAFCDHEIGRLVGYLRDSGLDKNTLVFYLQGDNGASGEGGPRGRLHEQAAILRHFLPTSDAYRLAHLDEMGGPATYELYPAEWAWAMDTPFQWFKEVASHFGGTRNGMVISWPGHIEQVGGIRTQYSYVDDIVPTILDVTGIPAPKTVNGVKQQSIDGISLAYTFDDAHAKTRHTEQYIEMIQNVSMYDNGWVAATRPAGMPWNLFQVGTVSLNKRQWQLYDVDHDFSEADDLASEHPQKLRELQWQLLKEGWRYKVFPVHAPMDGTAGKPSLASGRTVFTYPPGLTGLYQDDAPPVANQSFSVSADVVVQTAHENGVLLAQGGRFSGYSLYMLNGRLAFCYNDVPPFVYTIRASQAVPPGHHILSADFAHDGGKPGSGGAVTLKVDGRAVAEGPVEHSFAVDWISHTEGLDIGQDLLTAVSSDYQVPDKFTGAIHSVTVTLGTAGKGAMAASRAGAEWASSVAQ